MVQTIEQPISNSLMLEIAKFRLAVVQANPIRSWEMGDKVQKFERGSNSSYGHYMAALGALVRHIFYDKRTIISYTLEGVLRRKETLIEAPEFIDVLQYEWNNNLF